MDIQLFKAILKERGLTCRKLAMEIEVSTNTISNIVTQKTNPNYDVIKKILIYLKLDAEVAMALFFNGTNPTNNGDESA